MDALVETFRLAQCAVLQAQRDLIALRLAQEGPNSGGACGGPLLPKWSAQEQQQEAARLLEAAARQLDGIAHERADWIAEELRERSLREALAAHDDRRRLQQAMDEMAREFTNRTDTYVRQHEEFARHSDQREAALATAAAWANGAAIAAQRCIEKKAFALAETAGRAGKAAQRRAAFGAWRLFAARHIITREVRRVTLLERQSQCAQAESLRLEELCARGRIDSEEAEGRWGFVGAYFASAQRMARVEGIDATEQTRRAWLLVKELNERAALQQCATIAIARQQRTNSDARLSEIGQLVVIYCARDALSQWRDFAERRRTHRRLSRVVEWFGAAAESVSEAYESKTELFVATLASHTWEEKHIRSQNLIGDLRLAEELTDRVLDTFSNTTAMWSGAHCECFMAEAKAMWSQNHIGDLRLAEELTDRVLDTFSNTTAMWSSAHCECFMAEAKAMWSQNHIGDLRLAEELTDRVLDTFSNTTAMWSGAHCECFMAEAKAMWSQNYVGDLRLAEELTDRVLDTFSNTTAMWSGAHYECFMAEAKALWISQSPTTSACIVPADSGSDGRCFCSGSPGHCASRGTGTENVGEMVAGLKEPLQAHGRKGSPTCLDDNDSLEEALRMLSEERAGLAKRAREVVDVMRYNAAESLEAQRQRHKEEVEELLSYQRFLEQRIVGKKHVDCGTQTSENKDTSESLEELLAYQTFLEQKIAGVHCTDSGTQTTLLDYEGIRQEEELRALRAQLEEIQRQKQDHVCHRSPTAGQPAPELAQMHDQKAIIVTETLVEVAEEYGRVLRALERDVDGRHAAFFSEVNILAAVERFSETLLSRCESDLETVSALGRSVAAKHISDLERKLCAAQHELGAARSELEEMRERLALCSTFAATTKHETETSALMATLRATRLQAEADISELKAQIDSVSREVREACEAHSRRESAALSAQIESLLTAMDREKADFAAERQSLMDEADRLRGQIRDSEEHFERTAAQIQESSAHEIAKLQSEALQLRAEADASLISARQRQKEIDLVKMERAVAACRRESQCALRLAAHWASAAADSFDAKLDALLTVAFATAAAPVGLTCAGECPSPCVSAELPHSMHFEGTCDSEQRIVAHATAAFCFFEALAGAAVELIDAKVSTLLTAFEVALPFSRGVCSLSAQPQPPARQWERTVGGSSSKGRPLRHDATVAPMACRARFPIITPPLQVIRADDVSLSMQRYSQMLNEQRHRNDSRLQQLDVLVMEVDDLIERGHAVDRLEKNLVRESPQR